MRRARGVIGAALFITVAGQNFWQSKIVLGMLRA
jgi:hypothetical protein